MRALSFLVGASVMILFPLLAEAQIPRLLSYQAVYADSTGNPKPDGIYTFTFRLYTTSSGGSAIWTEIKDLPVKKGLFSTQLGDITPLGAGVNFDRQYWLGVKPGSEPELTPRIPLDAASYSLNSVRADSAGFAQKANSAASAAKADTATYALKAAIPTAIDSARIAGTVPDSSLRLSKLAVWMLAGNIGTGTVPANGCVYYNFGSPKGGLVSDLVLPRSDVAVPGGTALSAYFSGANISGGVCNFTGTQITLPNPFIMRIYGIR
jgi:hypothetical protein